MTIELSDEECAAVYETLDDLSGDSARNVFAWDGTDNPSNVTTRAFVKIFTAAGRDVPENLRGA